MSYTTWTHLHGVLNYTKGHLYVVLWPWAGVARLVVVAKLGVVLVLANGHELEARTSRLWSGTFVIATARLICGKWSSDA